MSKINKNKKIDFLNTLIPIVLCNFITTWRVFINNLLILFTITIKSHAKAYKIAKKTASFLSELFQDSSLFIQD